MVGVIVPWNFPMPIAGWGFAPALAAGNTVVLKPAELTPLTAIRLGELALEAGLPEGVFTVLPGKGSVVGERFVDAPGRAQDRASPAPPRSGTRIMARLRRPGEAGDPRAGRQEREHRVRRRRPGARPRRPRRTASSTTPARTAAPVSRILVAAQRLRPVPGAARAGGRTASGSMRPAPRTPRWAR